MSKKNKNCNCTVEETTGWTTVKCCNICGLPIKGEVWDFEQLWMDAKDLLPDNDDNLLVIVNGEIEIAWFDTHHWTGSEGYRTPVTHWMKLPNKP